MALEVKRKRVDVDLILDQEKAEQVAALGADLERAMAQHVTEGGNAAAKRIADQIDRLRDEVKDDTVRITLEALPLSQWRQVLEANTVTENGVPKQHIEDICADAVRLMVRKTVPETPVEELANVMTELSDGQISPIWYAIRDLEQSEKLRCGKISKEQYDHWRYTFPEEDTTQRWAKVPSQGLSDLLVEAFKDQQKEK